MATSAGILCIFLVFSLFLLSTGPGQAPEAGRQPGVIYSLLILTRQMTHFVSKVLDLRALSCGRRETTCAADFGRFEGSVVKLWFSSIRVWEMHGDKSCLVVSPAVFTCGMEDRSFQFAMCCSWSFLGAGCWVLGAGCWVLGAGCWVPDNGF